MEEDSWLTDAKRDSELSQEQQQEMHSAIATMNNAWAHIEDALCHLLMRIIGELEDGLSTPYLGSAIFFAPSAIETRIAITSSAFRAYAAGELPEYQRIEPCWDKLLKRIFRKKETRNLVAHSVVGIIHHDDAQPDVRLVPSMYNFKRVMESFAPGQLPGLSAHDIAQSANLALGLCDRIEGFEHLVKSHRLGNETAFQKILLQLEAELNPSPPHPEAPT